MYVSMTINFINPEGRANTADLSAEQVEALKQIAGYKVVESFDLPEVPKVRIHRKPFEECEACSA